MSASSSARSPDEEAYIPLPKGGRVPVTLIPVLRDEINRKANETLDWLINSVIKDKINAHQFSIGLDVLFMTVNGLTGKDFITKITKADEICKAAFKDEEVVPAEVKQADRPITEDTW